MATQFEERMKSKEKTMKINYFTPKEAHTQQEGGKFSFSRRPNETIKERPIDKKLLTKWRKGEKSEGYAKTKFHSNKIRAREEVYEAVAEKSARAELLCKEEAGIIEGDNTHQITQFDIKAQADEATQQKIFDLRLDQFGPYRLDYTRNGRHLLLGGSRGHVAAFDWQTKSLHCEINVMETVSDVKWLHQETMFAVAQRKWVYCYDNQGIEIHCLKHLDSVLRLDFLPYHFLLVSSSSKGYLSYLDVSIGKEVNGKPTKQGRLDVLTVNPQSAVVHLGHPNGTVTLWTPSVKDPVAKVFCHNAGIRDLSIDSTGMYMASTAFDRQLKIFDLRMYRELSHYRYLKKQVPSLLDFSQKGLLAVSRDNVVEVYRDMTSLSQRPDKPYLYHRCDKMVQDVAFCPYEDVLGIGHAQGFSSVVIPGSGEANYDAMEANPFQSKSQRKHREVHMLLDKIQPEMISLDGEISKVDLETAKLLQEERNAKKYLKPDKLDFTPRHKMKGGSKAGKVMQRKKGVQEEHLREKVREIVRTKQKEGKLGAQNKARKGEKSSALDKLKKKDV